MKKKKILITIASLKRGGGAEKVADYLSRLSESFEISYLTFYKFDEEYCPANTTVTCLNENLSDNPLKKIIKIFSRAYAIKQICQNENIDLIISHMEENNIPSIFSKIFFLNKTKVVVCIHNNLKVKHTDFYIFIISILYLFSHRIVGVSKSIANQLNFSKLIKNRYATIHNAIDLENINKKKLETLNDSTFSNENRKKIINIGRLHPQKNHLLYIDSILNSSSHYAGFILGEGYLREDIQNYLLSKDQHKQIILMGYKKNVYKYLANSDLFILSSNYEGLPCSMLEAMACGLPIIATNFDFGSEEILSPNKSVHNIKKFIECEYGIITPINNVTEMSKAISHLFNNDALILKYKERSLERARDFEIEKIISNWKNIIENI